MTSYTHRRRGKDPVHGQGAACVEAISGDSTPWRDGEVVAVARTLNALFLHYHVHSVLEFGCADGANAALLACPKYVGLDRSVAAAETCRRRFQADPSRAFAPYRPESFDAELFAADAVLSLGPGCPASNGEHATYWRHVFSAARRLVVVCAPDALDGMQAIGDTAEDEGYQRLPVDSTPGLPHWTQARVASDNGPDARAASQQAALARLRLYSRAVTTREARWKTQRAPHALEPPRSTDAGAAPPHEQLAAWPAATVAEVPPPATGDGLRQTLAGLTTECIQIRQQVERLSDEHGASLARMARGLDRVDANVAVVYATLARILDRQHLLERSVLPFFEQKPADRIRYIETAIKRVYRKQYEDRDAMTLLFDRQRGPLGKWLEKTKPPWPTAGKNALGTATEKLKTVGLAPLRQWSAQCRLKAARLRHLASMGRRLVREDPAAVATWAVRFAAATARQPNRAKQILQSAYIHVCLRCGETPVSMYGRGDEPGAAAKERGPSGPGASAATVGSSAPGPGSGAGLLLRSYVAELRDYCRQHPTAPLVVLNSTAKPLAETRNVTYRATFFARELAFKGFPTVFSYYNWGSPPAVAAGQQMPLLELAADHLLDFAPLLATELNVANPKVFVCGIPDTRTAQVLALLKYGGFKIIYDVWDNHELFAEMQLAHWYDAAVEKYVALHADFVFGVCPPLLHKMAQFGVPEDRLHISTNGVPTDCVTDDLFRALSLRRHSNTVGYIGNISDHWFDWHAVRRLANVFPEFRFDLIGPLNTKDHLIGALPENVRLVGAMAREDAYAMAKTWRAGIVPHAPTEHILSADSVKVYEYLGLGLPVVTVHKDHLCHYPLVYCYQQPEDIVGALRKAVSVFPDDELKAQYESFIVTKTWGFLTEEMLRTAGAWV